MKFGRRAFLQFAAGVVGGTLLSPLPWKLADDSAIWTQNWSFRPSPERGHITETPSVCTLCGAGGCGVKARVVNAAHKNMILLKGNPVHPINRGGICPLGSSATQFLYAPYRISQPMKQTGKRGDTKSFQPISWDEALGELTNRLVKLRTEGKANGVATITSRRRSSMDELWRQFMTGYGSPNLFKMPSHADSLRLAAGLTTGKNVPFAFALERADYVLSFGANLLEGWGAPCRMQAAYELWRTPQSGRGPVKLVQVDSRCSMTAAKADRWVPVAPGSEAALALGIAHALIQENLYDTNFMTNQVFGFEDWTDSQGKARQGFKSLVMASYAPEQVAAQCGVEAASIRELAREFAAQKQAIALWGSPQGDVPSNIYDDLTFVALNALKGNLKSGGLISLAPAVPLAELPVVSLDSPAEQAMSRKRLDLAQSGSVPLPGNDLHAFLDTVAKGGAYPIEMLLVHEANPAFSLPETQVFEAALSKIGLLVSFSSYMDETASQADFILPDHCALERYDDVLGIQGAPFAYYAVAAPAHAPLLHTKHTGDVVLALGQALGGNLATALPWKTYDAFLQERVNGLASSGKGAVADKEGLELWKLEAGQAVSANYKDGSDLWKKLTSGLCWYDAPTEFGQNLSTGSGKFELACQLLQAKGFVVGEDMVYLPHYAPLAPSGKEADLPLLLVSYEQLSLSDHYLPNPPFMTKTLRDTVLTGNDLFVDLHPKTASSLGMKQGDPAVLKTPRGERSVRVNLSPAARAGVVYMVQGLGHTAYDQYIQDKGVNANSVVEVQMDPVTGLGTVWATRAQLRRA